MAGDRTEPDPGGATIEMGPTTRDWLGAAVLTVVLVALVLLLVVAGSGAAKPA